MKVICIEYARGKNISKINDKGIPPPVVGEIYTVIDSWQYGIHKMYTLREWYPDDSDWDALFFRPVQDIGDQIEEHIREEIKKEKLEPVTI